MSATVALEGAPSESAERTEQVEQVVEGQERTATRAEQIEQDETEGTEEESRQEEVEQKEAMEAKEEEEAKSESTLTPRPTTSAQVPRSQREREVAAERIRQGTLPPALKERLAALVEAGGAPEEDGKHRVSIDDAVRAIEEVLPEFLRMDKGRASRAEHPDGDGFFSGEAGELSDARAEELARGQLARSGLLRGQRARVAE